MGINVIIWFRYIKKSCQKPSSHKQVTNGNTVNSGKPSYLFTKIRIFYLRLNTHSSCCEDIPGCLCAMCLTPCYVYLTVEKTGESTCCAILSCCFPIATVCVRGNVREKKGIDGSCMGDFCSILFCGCCTLIQMNREYGEWLHFF